MGISLTYLAIQCAVTRELFFNIYINLYIKSVNIKNKGAIYINTDMQYYTHTHTHTHTHIYIYIYMCDALS